MVLSIKKDKGGDDSTMGQADGKLQTQLVCLS